ncbi:MAG: hypothetical protein JXQ84_06625 [Rhodospirillaceae bacterium]|nr:hypothetical protein [Rhodospirillaceae bacterium]
MSHHSNPWRFLDRTPTWLSHAALLSPPTDGGAIWHAIADRRFDAAMAMTATAFESEESGEICETMGLLCRIAKREDMARDCFALAPPPTPRVWRNRGVTALWSRQWAEASTAFAAGTGNDTDGLWCRDAQGLMAVIARHWDQAATILGPPSEPNPTGLGPITHLCQMAAAWGQNGLSADLGPDIRPGLLFSPEATVAAPNAGCGTPERSVTGDLIAFLACDPIYLDRYGLSALASFAEAHHGLPLGAHLHLYDPTPQSRAQAENAAKALGLDLVLTTEITPPEPDISKRGVYYACARFCRLAEAFPTYGAPIMALDADALVRRNITPLFSHISTVALTCSPLTVPWNRHPAGFLLLRPKQAAADFLNTVARLIGDSLGRGRRLWFLDQWALLLAAQHHRAAGLRHLPWRWTYDTTFGPHAWVWQANDDRKSSPPYSTEATRLRHAAQTTEA